MIERVPWKEIEDQLVDRLAVGMEAIVKHQDDIRDKQDGWFSSFTNNSIKDSRITVLHVLWCSDLCLPDGRYPRVLDENINLSEGVITIPMSPDIYSFFRPHSYLFTTRIMKRALNASDALDPYYAGTIHETVNGYMSITVYHKRQY